MTVQSPGTPIADFHLVDTTGATFSLREYTGKQNVVLVLMRGIW